MLVLRGCRKRSTSPGAVFGVRPITSRLGAAHRIQRARHAQSPAPHGMGINHSPGHVRMAEQFLDTPDIGIGRQKMGSEAVPKRMAGHSRGQPGRSCGFFYGLLNHGLMDMVAAHDTRARVLRRPEKGTAGVASIWPSEVGRNVAEEPGLLFVGARQSGLGRHSLPPRRPVRRQVNAKRGPSLICGATCSECRDLLVRCRLYCPVVFVSFLPLQDSPWVGYSLLFNQPVLSRFTAGEQLMPSLHLRRRRSSH